MPTLKDILKNIPEPSGDDEGADLMADPEYIRHSSDFISDMLRKGIDVLQLENGDVVTTETKTVTRVYRWDAENQKMARLSAREQKERANKAKADEDAEE